MFNACAGVSMARYEFIAVYLMASGRNGTLYLGVTSNLLDPGAQHRRGVVEGFSARHGCTQLVWFERWPDMTSAIAR